MTGAATKNPQRFRHRKKIKYAQALGAPYERMSEAEKVIWEAFKAEVPWLSSSHRRIVHLGVQYVIALKTEKFNPAIASGLHSLLRSIGATPTEETKIADLIKFGTAPAHHQQPNSKENS